MLKKGYIEGFYGRLLDWQGRSMLLDTLSELSMDFYIYGPKEDRFHRKDWQILYPKEILEDLKNFQIKSDKLGIKTFIALSPNVSIKKGRKKELKSLEKKIGQLLSIGCKDFAIFFDDIDSLRDKELAQNQSEVLRIVSETIESKKNTSLIFCPTVYCESFAKGSLVESEYLNVLSDEVPEEIPILWTGKEVVSKSIEDKHIVSLNKVIKNPVIIWDNYYANDYCPNNFFIGPYKNRNISKKSAYGVGINPTGMPITDSILLNQFSGTAKTEEILEKFNVPKGFNDLLPFFNGPFDKKPNMGNPSKIKETIKATMKLSEEWKSPLQLEWATFLWKLSIDLNFLLKFKAKKNKQGKTSIQDKKKLEQWASQRYSTPLFNIIFKEKNKK
tara:strand:+ start:3325 stop:4485 length:1161 start_codon:yes stop_codon:yes gene_type:complete